MIFFFNIQVLKIMLRKGFPLEARYISVSLQLKRIGGVQGFQKNLGKKVFSRILSFMRQYLVEP